MVIKKTVNIGEGELSFETGKVAKLAHGSTWVRLGDTVVLVAVVASNEYLDDKDFVPLTVDYREKAYAAGKIPGGFFKREGRPTDKETLSARLTDRPIRALFNKDFKFETMVQITILSSDQENDADILGLNGASAALCISDIPFDTTFGAVRVGKVDGKLVANPTNSQLNESTINMIVAASEDSIVMVEGEAKEITNEECMEALEFAHENIKSIIKTIEELVSECGKGKREVPETETNEELLKKVEEIARPLVQKALEAKEKTLRQAAMSEVKKSVIEALAEEYPDNERFIKGQVMEVEKVLLRSMIVSDGKRVDGRSVTEIRPITCEVSVLPRTHGSALFTRGETQALAVTTLGSKDDEQKIENLDNSYYKRYMLHYNFPPFCVGEVRRIMGPGRREIGHGNLAERALKNIIPPEEKFPYTIRIVSEIFESNGSSSMATICAGSLSLMDAGVPVPKPTAGIAMGLIKDEDNFIVLSDILGDEDHLGDMDFKVAGSNDGITAIQMDIKIKGIPLEVANRVLSQAREGISHIIGEMNKALDKPRPELSPYAPFIDIFKIDVSDIGTIIGPGGKMIREIQDKTDSKIFIEEDGKVIVSAPDQERGNETRRIIERLTEKPEVGKIYQATVKKIMDFGAFVEYLPGKEGLLHVSEMAAHRVNNVRDVVKLGEKLEVKIKRIERNGKIDLTRKYLFNK